MQQPPNGPSRSSDSGKSPAKGASLGRPGHKGFIPPRVNREKVQVARPQPIAPQPTAAPPVVQEVVSPPPPELIGHTVEAGSADQPVVEARTKPPAASRRPLLRYYGGGLLSGVLILAAAMFAGFWVHS